MAAGGGRLGRWRRRGVRRPRVRGGRSARGTGRRRAGPGEQHRGAGAVLGLVGEKAVPEPVEGPAVQPVEVVAAYAGVGQWPGRSSPWGTSPTSTCPSKRDRAISKGGTTDWVHWQTGTAMLLPRLLAGRREGPVFLTARKPGHAVASATCARPLGERGCPTGGPPSRSSSRLARWPTPAHVTKS